MEMKEHILNTIKASPHRDEDGWVSSYYLAKDAKVSNTTIMMRASDLALDGKLERKEETVKNVRRIMWRVKL